MDPIIGIAIMVITVSIIIGIVASVWESESVSRAVMIESWWQEATQMESDNRRMQDCSHESDSCIHNGEWPVPTP